MRVPEVITHIETKTVTVTTPLSKSCKEAIKTLTDIEPLDSTIDASTGTASDEIGKANLAVAQHDIAAANKSIQKLTGIKVDLDQAIVSKSAMEITLKDQLTKCNESTLP